MSSQAKRPRLTGAALATTAAADDSLDGADAEQALAAAAPPTDSAAGRAGEADSDGDGQQDDHGHDHDRDDDDDDDRDSDNDDDDDDDDDDDGAHGFSFRELQAAALAWVQQQRLKGRTAQEVVSSLGMDVRRHVEAQGSDSDLWSAVVHRLLVHMLEHTSPMRAPLTSLEAVVAQLRDAKQILVVTGAGVSTSCGIPDFRSPQGLYARLKHEYPELHRPEDMFDMHFFMFDPRPFYEFAREIYPGQFQPSLCHRFIAALERRGKLLRNYTQNIDTLEMTANIERAVQCHGSFRTASCILCSHRVSGESIRDEVFAGKIPLCPKCPAPTKPVEEIIQRCAEAGHRFRELMRHSGSSDGSGSDSGSDSGGDQSSANGRAKDKPSHGNVAEGDGAKTDTGASTLPKTSSLDAATGVASDSPVDPSAGPGPGPEVRESGDEAAGESSVARAAGHVMLRSLLDNAEAQRLWMRENIRAKGVPVMKPDITFFHEDLPQDFYDLLSEDRFKCDLLLVIGSSLMVQPVSRIPELVLQEIPHILINREPLENHSFNAELLGDCDIISRLLAHELAMDELLDAAHSARPVTSEAGAPTEASSGATNSGIAAAGSAAGATESAESAVVGETRQHHGGSHIYVHPGSFLFRGSSMDDQRARQRLEEARQEVVEILMANHGEQASSAGSSDRPSGAGDDDSSHHGGDDKRPDGNAEDDEDVEAVDSSRR